MKPRLTYRAIPVPRADAEARLQRAISLLAEGFAEVCIRKAREEVADELGLSEEQIDREQDRVSDEVEHLARGGR